MAENNIPVSIGILTYNSARTLSRCLDSLKGFAEIIIADGGSGDNTLEIAQKYGCKIIRQSRQGAPIDDFSRERNLTLAAATQDWFFYLDADEIMSDALKARLREISRQTRPHYYVYWVAYHLVNADNTKIYKQFKTYYQPRFFSTKIGASFIKPVHERIKYDQDKYTAGKIDDPWYVPLDTQLDFSVYRGKVRQRLELLTAVYSNPSLIGYLKKVIFGPLLAIVKQVVKIIVVRIKYKKEEVVPFRYELFRIYSQWVLLEKLTKRYLQIISKRNAGTK